MPRQIATFLPHSRQERDKSLSLLVSPRASVRTDWLKGCARVKSVGGGGERKMLSRRTVNGPMMVIDVTCLTERKTMRLIRDVDWNCRFMGNKRASRSSLDS